MTEGLENMNRSLNGFLHLDHRNKNYITFKKNFNTCLATKKFPGILIIRHNITQLKQKLKQYLIEQQILF
jgi:hypothetical protein